MKCTAAGASGSLSCVCFPAARPAPPVSGRACLPVASFQHVTGCRTTAREPSPAAEVQRARNSWELGGGVSFGGSPPARSPALIVLPKWTEGTTSSSGLFVCAQAQAQILLPALARALDLPLPKRRFAAQSCRSKKNIGDRSEQTWSFFTRPRQLVLMTLSRRMGSASSMARIS